MAGQIITHEIRSVFSGGANPFDLVRSDAHGDAADIATISFIGVNDASAPTTYASITGTCVSDAAGAETASLNLQLVTGDALFLDGTFTKVIRNGGPPLFWIQRTDDHGDAAVLGMLQFVGVDSTSAVQSYAYISGTCVLDNVGAVEAALTFYLTDVGTTLFLSKDGLELFDPSLALYFEDKSQATSSKIYSNAGPLLIATGGTGSWEDLFQFATASLTIYQGSGGAVQASIIAADGMHLLLLPEGNVQTSPGVTGGVAVHHQMLIAKNISASIKTAYVVKDYASDLFDFAGLSDSANIWTQPADSVLLSAAVMLNKQFTSSGALTDLDVEVGDGGDSNGLLAPAAMNLKTDANYTQYKDRGAYWNTIGGYYTDAAHTWIGYSTATGANLNTLTAGEVVFVFVYLEIGA